MISEAMLSIAFVLLGEITQQEVKGYQLDLHEYTMDNTYFIKPEIHFLL